MSDFVHITIDGTEFEIEGEYDGGDSYMGHASGFDVELVRYKGVVLPGIALADDFLELCASEATAKFQHNLKLDAERD